MARPMKPLVRSGGYYPSRKWTPLVYNGGYTTMNGGEEPEPLPIKKTVIGNPIHITDALAKPAQALSVKLEPIQDLHGYDNPWPAGGGKNLCDPSTIIVGFWDGTGTYSADANYKTSALIPVEPNTNYTGTFFKADKTEVNKLVYTEWDSSENFIKQSTSSDRFVTTANTAYVRVRNYNAQSSLITSNDFLYQFEKGSATAYAPYSNICPISGHTNADVSRTGKNLANMFNDGKVPSVSNGQLVTANGYRSDFIPFKANAAFTFHATGAVVYMMCYDKDKNFLSAFSNNTGTITNTTPANTAYVMLRKDNNTAPTDAQLEYGTASDYQPYVGTTYPIPLGQTVYGGTLDVTNGVLTVDRAIVDMGTLNWIYYSAQQRIVAQVNSGKPAGANVGLDGACSVYKVVNTAYRQAPDKSIVIGNNFISNSYAAMVVHDENYTDAATFKTAVSGHTLVYPIKTPATYQLTPTEVTLLLGENNLFSDGEMTLVYLADGNASDEEALNILLGGRYVNKHGEDEPTDREALNIILGENER